MPNQLLNQAAPIGAPSNPNQEKAMSDEKAPHRQCLYKKRTAEIFVGDDAIEAALADGWVDHPDKVKQAPAPAKKKASKKAAKKKGK